MYKIVIDTLGSDMGMETVVSGVAKALQQGLDFYPVLVGPEEEMGRILLQAGIGAEQYELVDGRRYIRNEDPPTAIFGEGNDATMAMAYDRLKKDSSCDAMLSAGNTGAMLVGSICRLGLLPGLKFPVLASALPCNGENLLCLMDCGANIDCSAEDLVRFARMGHVFAKSYVGIENPRIGLMNVGREPQKGTALMKEAFEKISALGLNFVGNVEGSDLVSGYVDVIVSDGFSGNLLLKCAESVGKAAMQIVRRCGGEQAMADKICQALYETFDFNSRGAATFLGTKKTVLKMHGAANADTVVASIAQILRLENSRFSQAMAEEFTK
jgi:glycerol-3-phosphate acyltransferase PlsX